MVGSDYRRERRRADARAELRFAHERFSDFRMEAFAERARIELLATGEHARKRTIDTSRQLTPQEAQISRLAAKGNTNKEIAAQLFISPKTVEYHLQKAFWRLDVKSRAATREPHLIDAPAAQRVAVMAIQAKDHNRARRRRGFRTPNEVVHDILAMDQQTPVATAP